MQKRDEPKAVAPGRTVRFIRHAESEGNIGLPTDLPETIRLTECGLRQAADLAEGFAEAPDLIVVSPYLRTQQTAAPLMARYPRVPVEIWPVQEFTYLNPLKYRGTTQEERGRFARGYWQTCDAQWNDGGGAESFAEFIARIDDLCDRLSARQSLSVATFTHGYFIMGLQLRLRHRKAPADDALMAAFRDQRRINPPRNGEVFTLPF